MPVTVALFNHPHPLIRAVVVLMFLGLLFAILLVLLGAAIAARYRRHAELTSRLKSLEDKLDRLASPPTPPVSK